jgi:hypothetical protein
MASSSPPAPPLLRILCLHGSRQDAEVFSQRVEVLRRRLRDVAVSEPAVLAHPWHASVYCTAPQLHCIVVRLVVDSREVGNSVSRYLSQALGMLHTKCTASLKGPSVVTCMAVARQISFPTSHASPPHPCSILFYFRSVVLPSSLTGPGLS